MEHQPRKVDAREGYAIWAPFYDQERNPLILTEMPRAEKLLERLPRPDTVLDVAVGTGRWALWWARRGVTVTGIDQSPEMLAVAREKARSEGLDVTWIEGQMEDGLPFPDGTFDLATCALVLSHTDDLTGNIAECARVVRPGGYLLITDFHPQAIANGWKPQIQAPDGNYQLPAPDHTLDEYLAALSNAGMTLVHREEVTVREQERDTIGVPDEYLDAFIERFGDWTFCLILLGQKQE